MNGPDYVGMKNVIFFKIWAILIFFCFLNEMVSFWARVHWTILWTIFRLQCPECDWICILDFLINHCTCQMYLLKVNLLSIKRAIFQFLINLGPIFGPKSKNGHNSKFLLPRGIYDKNLVKKLLPTLSVLWWFFRRTTVKIRMVLLDHLFT